MLFNSHEFIFVFLPVVVAGFYLLNSRDRTAAVLWLGAASLFFYGWWNWRLLPLLLGSVIFNFAMGILMMRMDNAKWVRLRLVTVIFAVTANLTALAYYKYANFLVANLNLVLPHPLEISKVILPIGISFFTFTQVAFLIDAYVHEAREPRFHNYLLFVTYFPHLVAGPILHHKEMMPQFERASLGSISENIAVGASVFVIGLFKKVVIADNVAVFAGPAFDGVHQGAALSLVEAWCAPIAYTFQLYFDFSGYSDMAVGLSRMFGILLPLNFDSPLKARSIIEFWQRWHMTLTRYLRLYLYTPIAAKIMSWRLDHGYGISRRDAQSFAGFSAMIAVPLFYTMGLAGIWHGAGTQFLVFGLLHGAYLTANHGWRTFRRASRAPGHLFAGLGVVRDLALTFGAVVVANVFFRASSVPEAWSILRGMVGLNGVVLPGSYAAYLGPLAAPLVRLGVRFETSILFYSGWIEIAVFAVLFAIVWTLPNTQQIMERYGPALDVVPRPGKASVLLWRPNLISAAAIAALAIASVVSLSHVSEFLYFQF